MIVDNSGYKYISEYHLLNYIIKMWIHVNFQGQTIIDNDLNFTMIQISLHYS